MLKASEKVGEVTLGHSPIMLLRGVRYARRSKAYAGYDERKMTYVALKSGLALNIGKITLAPADEGVTALH